MSGTLVLDCEGLSKLVQRAPELTEWPAEAEDIRVVTSSATLVEARDPRTNQARFDYAVSRVNIAPPTEAIARHAGQLLAAAGLHGHKYLLDALVVATALASPPGPTGRPAARTPPRTPPRPRLRTLIRVEPSPPARSTPCSTVRNRLVRGHDRCHTAFSVMPR